MLATTVMSSLPSGSMMTARLRLSKGAYMVPMVCQS